jgi:hypothetical protein
VLADVFERAQASYNAEWSFNSRLSDIISDDVDMVVEDFSGPVAGHFVNSGNLVAAPHEEGAPGT